MTRKFLPDNRNDETGQRWMRIVLGFWLALTIAVAVRTSIWPEKRTVFPVFSSGAIRWWSDEPLYLPYSDITGGFRYSPTFAVFMTPFALLGSTAGGIAWSWFNLAIYFWGLRRLLDILPEAWSTTQQAGFLALGLAGGIRCVWNAQANTLVIGLLLLGAVAVVRRRWWSAAFLLAGPVFLKVSPAAVALLLAAMWPRRLAGRFLLALAVGLALPFLTRSPVVVAHHYQEWLVHLVESSAMRWPGMRDGWTVWLLLENTFSDVPARDLQMTPIDSPAYRILQVLSAAAALAWCLALQSSSLPVRWQVMSALGAGIGWLMIFCPATEFPTHVLLAPLLGWAVLHSWNERRSRMLTGGAVLLLLVLPWEAVTGWCSDQLPLLKAVLPAGATLLVVWLVGTVSSRMGLPMPDLSYLSSTGRWTQQDAVAVDRH
jgi:hypothetical protein